MSLTLLFIYDEVKDLRPVDSNHLKQELDDVVHQIEDDAEKKRVDEDQMNLRIDEYSRKMHDAEIIAELESRLPDKGLTTEKDDYEIKRSVRNIMTDLAHDKNFDPETMTLKQ